MSDKDKAQRRVYMLPGELVERIVAYQSEMGIASEVEAARRLLDDALKRRDTPYDIIMRFRSKMKGNKLLSDAARDIIVGHPLLTSLNIEKDRIRIKLNSGSVIEIKDDGKSSIDAGGPIPFFYDENGKHIDHDDYDMPF